MYSVVALVTNLVHLLLWPVYAIVRARAAPRGAWLRVEIEGPVVAVAPRRPFWDRRPRPVSLHELARLVEVSAADRRVAGLLVVLGAWQGGSATASALRRVLVAARQRGKRVVVYLPRGAGTRSTYVASAADRIIVAPQAHLAPLGYAVEAHYLKDAFAWMGVEPEVLAHGRYKAAGETLIASDMSAAHREQLEALLDDAYATLVAALADGRRVSEKLVAEWIDGGPWSALTAIRQGLVDASAHPDELAQKLVAGAGATVPVIAARTYLKRRVQRLRPWRRAPRIGVLEIVGPIMEPGPLPVPVASGERFMKLVERVLRDRTIRGVIVHISSPGGSVLVSDHLLHGVRRLAAKLPVVASFGDVAASGGYLAAAGASAIHAEPTTVTGSIGVVAARIGVGPLLARLGIAVRTVKRGRHADVDSPTRALASDERAHLEAELADVYRYFVESVAAGRGRPVSEIEALAEGRVYSGTAAHRLGLIDGLGGFSGALADLRERIGPGAARLEPELIDAGWHPPDLVAAILPLKLALPSPMTDTIVRTLGASPERVQLWCAPHLVELGRGP